MQNEIKSRCLVFEQKYRACWVKIHDDWMKFFKVSRFFTFFKNSKLIAENKLHQSQFKNHMK